jgi:hypothetical protein
MGKKLDTDKQKKKERRMKDSLSCSHTFLHSTIQKEAANVDIGQVPGSNLGPEIGWSKALRGFASPSRQTPALHLKLGHDHLRLHPLKLITHLSPYI